MEHVGFQGSCRIRYLPPRPRAQRTRRIGFEVGDEGVEEAKEIGLGQFDLVPSSIFRADLAGFVFDGGVGCQHAVVEKSGTSQYRLPTRQDLHHMVDLEGDAHLNRNICVEMLLRLRPVNEHR